MRRASYRLVNPNNITGVIRYEGEAIPPTAEQTFKLGTSQPCAVPDAETAVWLFNRQVPLGAIITQKRGRELCALPCRRAVSILQVTRHLNAVSK